MSVTPQAAVSAITAITEETLVSGYLLTRLEQLGWDPRWALTVSLALRTSAGVPADVLDDQPELRGLVWRRAERAGLTPSGRLLANAVSLHLR